MQPFLAHFKKNALERGNEEFDGLIVQITNEENSSDAGSEDKVWYINQQTNKLEYVMAYKYDIFKIN